MSSARFAWATARLERALDEARDCANVYERDARDERLDEFTRSCAVLDYVGWTDRADRIEWLLRATEHGYLPERTTR